MSWIKRGLVQGGEIAGRFKRRDFSGNEGQAIKNSTYSLMTSLSSKIGSLIFVFLLARILMPELYGFYSATLSVILVFTVLGDLGYQNAMIRYLSEFFGKKDNEKVKSYFRYIVNKKKLLIGFTIFNFILCLAIYYLLFILINYILVVCFIIFYLVISLLFFKKINLWEKRSFDILISGILLFLFIFIIWYTNNNSPFYIALIGGIFYLLFGLGRSIYGAIFPANNDFKTGAMVEIIFELSRIFFVLPLMYYLVRLSINKQILILILILALAISHMFSFFYLYFKSKKYDLFGEFRKLNLKEKRELNLFVLPLTATALSGVFFGYVDTIMLKHYVTDSFIGYYGAAFSLATSAITIMGFGASAIFPIFSRLRGEALLRAFRKTRYIVLAVSFCAAIFTFFIAPYVIRIAYGSAYSQSIIFLKIFSLLLISGPLSAFYLSYFTSQKNTKLIAKLLIGTTILNIIFNYFGITYGLVNYGEVGAVFGACIATIASRYIYLVGLVFGRREGSFIN